MVAFALFEAAFYAEIIRSGIRSVPKSQIAACLALGMSYAQAMRLVILPQAFRNMVPLLLTQGIILFQDTSLVYVSALADFFGTAYKVGEPRRPPGRAAAVLRRCLFHHLLFGIPAGQALPEEESLMISIRNVSKHYGQFQVLTELFGRD